FVCNETFNKLKFIHYHYGHSDRQWRETKQIAREILREQGWRPKRTITAHVEQGDVVLPYSYELPLETGENLLYLEQRGVDADLAKYFHLRWCEFGFWSFTDENGKKDIQRFDNRIIIPVFDLDGALMTFQGRDLTGVSKSKYLFPKMLPGTGRFLFNGQNVMIT